MAALSSAGFGMRHKGLIIARLRKFGGKVSPPEPAKAREPGNPALIARNSDGRARMGVDQVGPPVGLVGEVHQQRP